MSDLVKEMKGNEFSLKTNAYVRPVMHNLQQLGLFDLTAIILPYILETNNFHCMLCFFFLLISYLL